MPDGDDFSDAALGRAVAAAQAMPDYVGRYRILESLGQGGMGEVYVAEQTTPIKRCVAIKLIKPGMDNVASGQRVSSQKTRVMPVAVLPEHNRVIGFVSAGGATGSLIIGNLATGQPIVVLNEGAQFLNRAYLSPSGDAVAFVRSRFETGLLPPATVGQAEQRLGQPQAVREVCEAIRTKFEVKKHGR